MTWEIELTENNTCGNKDTSLNRQQRDFRVTLASILVIKRAMVYNGVQISKRACFCNHMSIIKILEKITRIYSKFLLRTRYVLTYGSTIVSFNSTENPVAYNINK
jgi:hypothetical protein